MGKKRHTNTVTLGVPFSKTGGTGSYKDPRESDPSDLESLAYSSLAGDLETELEDTNDLTNQINALSELIENAQDKKIEIRTKAIDTIISILSRHYVPDNLQPWIMTLFEIIEKNLKRTIEESVRMCTLSALLSVQLGIEVEGKMCSVIEILRSISIDPTANDVLRSAAAQSLGLCAYLSVDFHSRYEALQTLKNIWTGLKPNSAGSTSLFSSALYSWVLLLGKFDSSVIMTSMELQPKLCIYLESTTVEARISAGETLAILYEIAIENVDENFQFKNQEQLEEILADLAVDSAKNRAKRDRKLQKLSFRQINDTIFGEKDLNIEVKFNKTEKLVIKTCHQKLLYDSLCQLLRGDMNKHLTSNEFLRNIFDMGPVLDLDEEIDDPKRLKAKKAEIMSYYGEQSKSRNIQRSKFRSRKHDHHAHFEE